MRIWPAILGCLASFQVFATSDSIAQDRIPKSFQPIEVTSGYRFDLAGQYQPMRSRALRHIYESDIIEFIRSLESQDELGLTKPQKERLAKAIKKYDSAFTKVKNALKSRRLTAVHDQEFLEGVVDFNKEISGLLSRKQRVLQNELIARKRIIDAGPVSVARKGIKLHLFSEEAETFEEIKPSSKILEVSGAAFIQDAKKFLKRYQLTSSRVVKDLIGDLTDGFPESVRKDVTDAFHQQSWTCNNLSLLGFHLKLDASVLSPKKTDGSMLRPPYVLQTNLVCEFEIQKKSGLRGTPVPLFYILNSPEVFKKMNLEVTEDQISRMGQPYTNYVNQRMQLSREYSRAKSQQERGELLASLNELGEVLNGEAEKVLLEPQLKRMRAFGMRYYSIRNGMKSAIHTVLNRYHRDLQESLSKKMEQNVDTARTKFVENMEKIEKDYLNWLEKYSEARVTKYMRVRPEDAIPQLDLLINELIVLCARSAKE